MTDLELQKLLAGEFPALIHIEEPFHETLDEALTSTKQTIFYWRESELVRDWKPITPREWLFIVSEFEKKLSQENFETSPAARYQEELWFLVEPAASSAGESDHVDNLHNFLCASWQQRATAYLKTIGKL